MTASNISAFEQSRRDDSVNWLVRCQSGPTIGIQDFVNKELEAKNIINASQPVCMEIIPCQTKLFLVFFLTTFWVWLIKTMLLT